MPLSSAWMFTPPIRFFTLINKYVHEYGTLPVVLEKVCKTYDGPIRGGEELNFTAGLNWYLRSNARVMVNYIRANLRDREDPPVDEGSADIIQMRFHIFF